MKVGDKKDAVRILDKAIEILEECDVYWLPSSIASHDRLRAVLREVKTLKENAAKNAVQTLNL